MNIRTFSAQNNCTNEKRFVKEERMFYMLDRIALILLIIGGINWGLVGIFQFDLVAWAFGGTAGIISRIIYVLVALSAIWCVSLFFKQGSLIEEN